MAKKLNFVILTMEHTSTQQILTMVRILGDRGFNGLPGYRIVDLGRLQNLLSEFPVCSNCRRGSISAVNCHGTGDWLWSDGQCCVVYTRQTH